MPRVNFFFEETLFKLPHPRKTKSWISAAISSEGFNLGELNYIFCTDNYLLSINKQYLNHSTYTDIVTFDNSEKADLIEGDIFISVDRVTENAVKFNVGVDNEVRRVMIHGALHLMGYTDKTKAQKALMREKEDAYLSLWNSK
jgi:probable rRNA maturation factor